MREIKFRFLITKDDEKIIKNYDLDQVVKGALNYYLHLDYKVKLIGEFTGLKDKNEVEIYEGDIIKVYDWDSTNHCEKLSTPITQVIFQNGCFGFNSDITNSFRAFSNCNRPGTTFEVIGNIYQNPELLESKNEG